MMFGLLDCVPMPIHTICPIVHVTDDVVSVPDAEHCAVVVAEPFPIDTYAVPVSVSQ